MHRFCVLCARVCAFLRVYFCVLACASTSRHFFLLCALAGPLLGDLPPSALVPPEHKPDGKEDTGKRAGMCVCVCVHVETVVVGVFVL